MVYMGPAEKAARFFIESPSLNFDFAEYTNPADFLTDISSCLFKNRDVNMNLIYFLKFRRVLSLILRHWSIISRAV